MTQMERLAEAPQPTQGAALRYIGIMVAFINRKDEAIVNSLKRLEFYQNLLLKN